MAADYGIYTDKYHGLLDAYFWMCENNIGTEVQRNDFRLKIDKQVSFLFEGSWGEPINEFENVETSVIWSAVYTILNQSLQLEHEFEMLARLLRVAGIKEQYIEGCRKLIGNHIDYGVIS